MHKKIRLQYFMFCWLICALCCIGSVKMNVHAASADVEKRAIWISYLDFQEYLQDKNEGRYRQLVTNMCNNAKNQNMNTIIVQVRPYSDAIYPSDYFPWATCVSSSGTNPGYDPLAIFVEVAHQKNLKIEAWINPYRISTTTNVTNRVRGTALFNTYRKHMIAYQSNSQNCLAWNPASEEARQIIVNGVKEIVQNYDVDGIHMDDYFYVTGMDDSLDVSSRKANVNKLVAALYATIKSVDPNCEFGISPAGNLNNARNAGADIDTWLSSNGYVDYLMPQIYWTDNYYQGGRLQTMFTNRARQWYSLKKNNVKMYVGLALYRVGTQSNVDRGWSVATNNLQQQYLNANNIGYKGYALFRYAWFDKAIASTELNNLRSSANKVNAASTGVNYTVHCQSYGWMATQANGGISGTTGKAKRLEAIAIKLANIDGGIRYSTHVQSYGWRNWSYDGQESGTTGQAKRLEAIKIELTGNAANQYDIYYRVHAQSYGWLPWQKNGEVAGTTGEGKRLEAIQIMLVDKKTAPGSNNVSATPDIVYSTHCQTYGWLGDSYNGLMNGSVGQAKRLEAIQIHLVNQQYSGNVIYRTHVQSYGWQDYVRNGTQSGTSGQAKRLEAIEIQLDGEMAQHYDVYYRVHVQGIGWQEWVCNGALAGTEGQARRLEAIEIKLVAK